MGSVMSRLARRFVAGETQAEAVEVVRALNARQVLGTLDILGENVASADDARRAAEAYRDLVQEIIKLKLESHASLKLTMLGLDISRELCIDNMRMLLRVAKEGGIFVRIDMEGSAYTEITLQVFETLRQEFDNVGIVLQAYLRRTEDDLRRVLACGGRVRLCKGAYKEPESLAFKSMWQIQGNYLRLSDTLLADSGYHAFATHDQRLIDGVNAIARGKGKNKDAYEFQMLYGLRRETWFALASQGHRFRVYVPYGTHWLPYFTRRLKERKENVFFVLSNLFSG